MLWSELRHVYAAPTVCAGGSSACVRAVGWSELRRVRAGGSGRARRATRGNQQLGSGSSRGVELGGGQRGGGGGRVLELELCEGEKR